MFPLLPLCLQRQHVRAVTATTTTDSLFARLSRSYNTGLNSQSSKSLRSFDLHYYSVLSLPVLHTHAEKIFNPVASQTSRFLHMLVEHKQLYIIK